jgi:hypothetical protein
MSGPVRHAGRAVLEDGSEIVWSVADGRRGRRWRTRTIRDGQLIATLLLEVDAAGRPSRLELAAPAGLLTLHPERSGGLHGNVVTPAGVRHLALPWSHDHELAIEGQPVADAVMVRRLAKTWPVGEGREIPVVAVTRDLEVREWRRRYRRLTGTHWSIEDDGGDRTASVDERGLPIWPASRGETSGAGEPTEWPLELDPSS